MKWTVAGWFIDIGVGVTVIAMTRQKAYEILLALKREGDVRMNESEVKALEVVLEVMETIGCKEK